MPKQNPSSMICSTKYGKCACCAYDSSNSSASSDGRRRLVVTSRTSKEEESRERQVKTVVDSSIKVCSDCRTSYTPLWRNGPDGPMSLCNACGIRYRKRKISVRMEERKARKVFSITGNAESKRNSNAEETKKGQRVKREKMVMTLSEEEMRMRQRDKQEKILMVMFHLRREAGSWRQRALRERSDEGVESEEVAEAALLLLYLSCGISVHF
ncbi:GATA transcription factor 16 [Dendrobium catenatum]|uniref:GATA transcription factor 16 n=1 Tax=Dendrobium catenatum TaxID=906689 RepID=A0A2I0WMD7_9ASPA|nr:GATA transcription factor 16 [Dendrobium catenatum]